MLTSKEFAKIIGVSQPTVSRALNYSPLVSEETAQYVRKKAEELGFVLNSQAKSLKTKLTGNIGILFPVFFESLSKNLMFTYIYDNVQNKLMECGYDVMVIYDNRQLSYGVDVLERTIKNQKVDGFVNLRPFLSEHERDLIHRYHVPCVALFNAPQEATVLNQFIVDEYAAAYQAGAYYAKQSGQENIFISIPMDSANSDIRFNGFRQGLQDGGQTVSQVITCDLSMNSAYQAVMDHADCFRDHQTASYVYNDMMAIGVVQALQDLGVAIPDQAQIIGNDGIPMGTWLPPYISTLQAPLHDMVEEACELLCGLIEGKKTEPQVKPYLSTLVHRGTTKN